MKFLTLLFVIFAALYDALFAAILLALIFVTPITLINTSIYAFEMLIIHTNMFNTGLSKWAALIFFMCIPIAVSHVITSNCISLTSRFTKGLNNSIDLITKLFQNK